MLVHSLLHPFAQRFSVECTAKVGVILEYALTPERVIETPKAITIGLKDKYVM